MSIYNYNEFINLKINEALKNFPLFISKRLRDILSNIDHNISKELLNKHSDLDTRVKQTFVDIHESKDDSITFIQPNKIVDILGWDLQDDEELDKLSDKYDINTLYNIDDNHALYKRYRGETRWGRFINTAFPNKFPLSISGGQNKEDIESFVNLYKALYNRESKFKLFDIVSGDDISYWYDCDNYYNNDDGSLADSCMKSVESDFFDIYTKNDKVSLIVMYSDISHNYIIGRALLWDLDEPQGRKFMDRVYVNNYSNEQVFIDYAKENGWLYKSSQSMGSDINIVDPINDIERLITLKIELNPTDYGNYPYLDTVRYYNPNTGILSNKQIFNPKYELTDTDGSYNEIDDYDYEPNYVYSKYHGVDIDERYAKYCIFGEDWVREDEAIRVFNCSGIIAVDRFGSTFTTPNGYEGYAVPGDPNIANMKLTINGENVNKYFPKIKCIWSEYLNTWIFKYCAVKVWLDFNRSKFGIDHKKRKGINFVEIDGENWAIDLVDNNNVLLQPVAPKVTYPVGEKPRGWHRRREFIDTEGNIFRHGIFSGNVNVR